MSLINQVLQDLDARQPESGPQAQLPGEVRPWPVARKSRWSLILLLLLLVVLTLGYFSGALERGLEEFLPEPQSAQPAPVTPLPAPVVATKTDSVPSSPPVHESSGAPPESGDGASNLPAVDYGLRLSDEMLALPAKAAERKNGVRSMPARTESAMPVESEAAGKKNSRAEDVERSRSPSVPAKAAAGKREGVVSIERTEVIGSPRERAEAEYRKAIAALNLGREAEALDGLRAALRQDGLHTASRQLLVKLLLESRQRDEAMSLLQEGVQEQPAQIGWAMSLARLQMDRGDLLGAWQTLDHSLPAAGNSADYQGFAGHVLQRLGRSREAAERYLLATRLSPADGRWWLGLGLAFEAEGRPSEAREAFLRAKQSGNLSPELVAMVEHKLR